MTEMSPAEAVFFAALERATAAERAAYLDAACAGDPALRSRVEKLLAAHPRVGGFLEPRPADGATADGPAKGPTATFGSDAGSTADFAGKDEHVGAILGGKYKLIEAIGEGGMGSVYMALQTEPVKRSVAVKVIKAGMDSKAVLARFEAERQALAMMDHPNIARVLDAGTTESGRPYFVMELVKGVPITQYCDERKLTPKQRLELFVPVCHAIQHAHMKGVIHRDIKPSNVLVALYDDRPVPKVIDFGVAKAAGQTLTDKTLVTGFGAVVGTPEYMSPEQASLNNLDTDTRSDVYSLGVLLYELLTGHTPVDRKSLGQAALLEILRIVREVEAPRPSAKLSTIDTLPRVAANRGTEPAKLSKLMKGELDWVLLKALEKDRARRYESANGLARDIQRYLADEIVEARPPSRGYRLRKFVTRHKGRVLAAGLVVLALLAGVVGTTYGLVRADRAARREAARAAQLERSNTLLKSVFRTLDPHDPDHAAGPLRAQLGRRLRAAVADLDGDTLGDPLPVARMQYLLGVSLLGLGYSEDAIGVLTKARDTLERELGPDSEEAMHAVAYLGDAHADLCHEAEAERVHAEVLARRTRVLGPDHPDTLVSQCDYASKLIRAHRPTEAVPLMESALAKHAAARGPDHTFTLLIATNLAHTLGTVGRREDGLKLSADALARSRAALGANHPRTVNAACVHAAVLHMDGKSADAIRLMEETLVGARAELGPDHASTLNGMTNLASYLAGTDARRAAALKAEVLTVWTARSGPHHPHTLAAAADLANSHLAMRKFEACAAVVQSALPAAEAHLGPDADTTLALVDALSHALCEQNQADRALPLAERYLAGVRKSHPEPDALVVLLAANQLGVALNKAGQAARALPLFEEYAAGRTRIDGLDHVETCVARYNVAFALQSLGRQAEALPVLEDVLRRMSAFEPKRRTDVLGLVLRDLGRAYRDAQWLPEALPAFTRSVEVLTAVHGADAEFTLGAAAERAEVQFLADPKTVDAAALELLIRKLETASGPTHFNTLKVLHIRMQLFRLSGQFDKLLPAAVTRAERTRTANGPDTDVTLQAESEAGAAYREAGQYARAEETARELVRKRERLNGKDDPRTQEERFYLGWAVMCGGQEDEGLGLMERALAAIAKAKPGNDRGVLFLMQELGNLCRERKRFDRAVAHLGTAARLSTASFGPEDRETKRVVAQLNQTYFFAGRLADAVPTCELVAKWTAAEKGDTHVETVQAIDRLAQACKAAKRPDDAVAARARVHAAFLKAKGPDDPDTLAALGLVADKRFEAGRVADAIRDFERIRAGWIKTRGAVAPVTLGYTNRLGVLYWNDRQFDKSIPLYEQLLAAQRKALGDAAPDTLLTMTNLGVNYCDGGRAKEGVPLLNEVLRTAKEPDLLNFARGALILHYLELGRAADAEPLARDHAAAARTAERANDPDRAGELGRAAEVYMKLKKWADAEPLLREALAVREKFEPGSLKVSVLQSLLGRTLAGRKKPAEAERLLLGGYAGLMKNQSLIPRISRFRLAEAPTRWSSSMPRRASRTRR